MGFIRKYAFDVLHKNGNSTITKTYYADSEHHAKQTRKNVIISKPIFIGPIRKIDTIGMPLMFKIQKKVD